MQVGRAATLVIGALRVKSLLDREELEPDYERTTPLDMSQYSRVFGSGLQMACLLSV